MNTVFSDWNTSAELTRNLVAIAAAEEEAVALLDILIEYTDSGTAIYDELVTIRESINTVSGEMATQFITRLRMKETSTSVSGNITKIIIPAMPRITGDVSVVCNGNSYRISGLKPGTYQYSFTNQKNVTALSKTFAVAQGETVTIPETADWTYLAIRTPATESNFESQIRYLVAGKNNNDWVIITEKKIVTGIPESTTVSEVVKSFKIRGEYRIPKACVIDYVLSPHYAEYRKSLKAQIP